MATLDDIRTIALALPGAEEAVEGHRGGVCWRTKNGLFVWERGPGKADIEKLAVTGRVWPEGVVVGVRTESLQSKEALLGSLPEVLFTIAHFDGYPAVLLRLNAVDRALLEELVTDAWLVRAPKSVAKKWLVDHQDAGGD